MGFHRKPKTLVIVTNVRHAAKTRLYDLKNRVCGYALTNSLGRGVDVTIGNRNSTSPAPSRESAS